MSFTSDDEVGPRPASGGMGDDAACPTPGPGTGVDAGLDAGLDALVRAAAAACGCPIALLGLVVGGGHRVAARTGAAFDSPACDDVLCAVALASTEATEIPDTLHDPRLADDPLVTGPARIRFYAGLPIVLHGVAVGTLCVADRSPRYLRAGEKGVLQQLALVAAALIDSRHEVQRAERAARDSERALRAITDHLPAVIVHVDADERYTYVNPHEQKVTGRRPEDMIGRTLRDVRGDEVYAHLRPHVERARAGDVTSFDGAAMALGGLRRYQSIYVPDGKAVDGAAGGGFYAMTVDVTEWKSAEVQRAASEKLLRDITDNLPALVCYVGMDNRYRFANAAYRDWLGFDHLAMTGRRVDELFDAATCAAMQPYIDRGRRGERVSFERRTVVDGQERDYFVEYIPDIDVDGTVHGIYAMSTDITARRRAESLLAESERRLLDLTNSIPAVIGRFDLDERCVFSNDVALRTHGIAAADIVGMPFAQAIGPALYAQHVPAIRTVLTGRRSTVEGWWQRGDRPLWFRAHLVPDRDIDGVQRGFYAMTFDVTSLKEAEHARALSEQRLRAITDNLPVLIAYIDADERMTFVNETFRAVLDVPLDRIVGRTVAEVVGPALYAERSEHLRRALAGERVDFEIESKLGDAVRIVQATYLPDRAADGSIAGIYTLSVDVTALKLAERRLSLLAHRDDLTGLPNRLSFNQELGRTLEAPLDPDASTALMFLDIDHFKTINDTHGHAVGDAVLRDFAERVRYRVRTTDFVARLAGDEFVVILRDLRGADEAREVAAKLVVDLERPFDIGGDVLRVTASVGIALHDDPSTRVADLLAKADVALYQAKQSGRNTYRLAA